MSKRTKSALCAAALACTGAAAFAASGFGDDPVTTGSPRYVTPAMKVVSDPSGGASREVSRRGTQKQPKVTNLITTKPLTVPAEGEVIAEVTCKQKLGIPLSGGAISNPPLAISVISRFDPGDLKHLKPRTYYVGVRNFGTTEANFHGTLVCAKGIDQFLP